MAENVKCLLVDLDNVLISEVEEVPSDCKLIRPYRFYQDGKLEPWVKASNQTEYMIRSSDILTIADPTPELVQEYLKLTTE